MSSNESVRMPTPTPYPNSYGLVPYSDSEPRGSSRKAQRSSPKKQLSPPAPVMAKSRPAGFRTPTPTPKPTEYNDRPYVGKDGSVLAAPALPAPVQENKKRKVRKKIKPRKDSEKNKINEICRKKYRDAYTYTNNYGQLSQISWNELKRKPHNELSNEEKVLKLFMVYKCGKDYFQVPNL